MARLRILCVNAGSSSLKLDLIETASIQDADRSLARAHAESIGSGPARLTLSHPLARHEEMPRAGHAEAFGRAIDWFEEAGLPRAGIDAVGHRVVHGGARFDRAALLDRSVLDGIGAASELAPLHNAPALAVIDAAAARLGPNVPMVATFDTAFFAALPDVAKYYAIPRDLAETFGVRRYGFHGLAHRFMVQEFTRTHPDLDRPRVLTLQLGSGCSATASIAGRPIDTSMGFTPLEGLIMGTRAGNIDPAVPLYLASKGVPADEVTSMLNTRSGLLALSGRSHDVRVLLQAARDGDAQAEAALQSFCYSIKKYIGAYTAALGGLDGVVFGGGVGENSPEIRARVCAGMEWFRIGLDPELNAADLGNASRLDSGAGVEVWAVRVAESAIIARDVEACLSAPST